MLKTIVENGNTWAKVSDLKVWEDNPRITDKHDFDLLKRMFRLGLHSNLLVMTDGTVLGGNTRLKAAEAAKRDRVKVNVVEFEEVNGHWEAIVDGERALEVDSNGNGTTHPTKFDTKEQAMLEYALSHNQRFSYNDEKKVAELATVNKIDLQLYKIDTMKPVEVMSVVQALGPHGPDALETGGGGNDGSGGLDGREKDENMFDQNLDTYMNGNVKQIVTYFGNEEFISIMAKIEQIMQEKKLESNTDVFVFLVDYYLGATAKDA
jgi:hypothetical protein